MITINDELLHAIFKESGLTYGQLADKVGAARNTISNIMHGRTCPTYYMARSITEELKIVTEDLCEIFFPNAKSKEELDEEIEEDPVPEEDE